MAINSIQTNNSIAQTSVNTNQSQNAGTVIKGSQESAITVNVKDLGLTTGQTFSGQVVEVNGNDIKLLLGNNQMINAKLEGNLNAILGQTISFEVSSTEGGHTALRPLYTNLTNSLAVSSALQSAGLPETVQYVNMVSTMMDESMSVNKNALWDMSKQINQNPFADPATIVQMTKIGLPIDELTINQFENYKGFEHQIKNDVINLANGLVDEMEAVLKESNPDIYNEITPDSKSQPLSAVNNILNSFINAVTGNGANQSAAVDSNVQNPEQPVNGENVTDESIVNNETGDINNPSTPTFNLNGLNIASQIIDLVDTSSEVLSEPVNDNVMKLVDSILKNIEGNADDTEKPADPVASESNAAIENKITDGETNESGRVPLDENVKSDSSVNNETASSRLNFGEVLDFAKNLINEINKEDSNVPDERKQMLSKLLSNDDFRTGLKNALQKQLLLKPDQVTDNNKVEDLYQKILKQADAAVQIMKDAGRDNPEIMKSASNLNDNVNFMNQLNQAVTYIQIPLLMNNKSAHGDLYVYTNKKSLKEKDGNLSALLHLDMENLGPMDVYVAMTNGTNVKTNFIMQDEATLDFIAEHIELLNDRLTKKGYNMSTNVTVKDKDSKKTNIVDEFMKEDPDSVSRIAAKYSFDVRA